MQYKFVLTKDEEPILAVLIVWHFYFHKGSESDDQTRLTL